MAEIHAIRVPQWGLEMTEGAVAEWHIALGDTIRKGAEIVDIETAKIVNVVEAGADLPGVVRRLVANVGDTLPVGAVLAVVAEASVGDAEIDAFLGGGDAAAGSAPVASPAEAPAVPTTASAHADAAPTQAVHASVSGAVAPTPATGAAHQALPTASAAPTVVPDHARHAASPSYDRSSNTQHDTAHATTQRTAPATAAIDAATPVTLDAAALAATAAANASVSASPIARRLADRLGIELAALRGTGVHGRVSVEDVQVVAWDRGHALPAPGAAAAPARGDLAQRNARAHASPIALRIANRDNIDLSTVSGTGRRGRIGVADLPSHPVQAVRPPHASRQTDTAAAAASLAPLDAPSGVHTATAEDAELIAFTPMRKAIAAGLVRSKQTIPHFYLTTDLPLDGALALRTQMNRTAEPHERLSINDFVLRATALALAAVPDANVHFTDAGTLRFRRVHLAVAVAIDGGLITPVLRDAHAKPLMRVSQEASALAKRARDRALTQADLADATFTVSNLGMHGVRNFDAVINPPQGGILAVGAVRREAYESDAGVAFRSVMSVTLSCDHRVIDGAVGAAFLAELRRRFEQPHMLLL